MTANFYIYSNNKKYTIKEFNFYHIINNNGNNCNVCELIQKGTKFTCQTDPAKLGYTNHEDKGVNKVNDCLLKRQKDTLLSANGPGTQLRKPKDEVPDNRHVYRRSE